LKRSLPDNISISGPQSGDSSQRIAIYKEVIESLAHPTAETIYSKLKKTLPNISFDIVNRTLLIFAAMGLIEIVECTGDARRFDPNIKKHHHFRCRYCGEIMDFYFEQYDNLRMPEQIKENFKIEKIRVIIEGICSRCLENKKISDH